MEALLEWVRQESGTLGLLAVFLGATLEYLIPPLPGDSIVFAGALLILAGSYSFFTVAAVAVAGGGLGSALHYALGRAFSDTSGRIRGRDWIERVMGAGSLHRAVASFRRYGPWVLLLNRAFPGVRGVIFLMAGASRVPFGLAIVAGLISNIAWTCGILVIGVSLGGQWSEIRGIIETYHLVFGVVFAVGLAGYFLHRRFKS